MQTAPGRLSHGHRPLPRQLLADPAFDGNNVRTVANSADTNERYHFENTPKHSIIGMFIHRLGFVRLAAKEADQVPQSDRREEGCRSLIRPMHLVPTAGPADRSEAQGTAADTPDAQSHQHPRCRSTPEHSPYPPRLAAVRAVFRNNRHRTSAECNIRCCLSLA